MELLLVINCTESDSLETFKQTLRAVINQKSNPFNIKLIAYCTPNCPEELIQYIKLETIVSHAVDTWFSFLNHSSSIIECDYVLLCACGVVPRENCFSFLVDKIKEYGENSILTAHGIRLFPHERLHDPSKQMKEGVHWKQYDKTRTDRVVHFFTPDFCFISTKVHQQVVVYFNTPLSQLGHLWYSFIIGHFLGLSVWKIQANNVVDYNNTQLLGFNPTDAIECFEQFYSHLFECDWPQAISHPLHSVEKMNGIKQCKDTPQEVWRMGFGGVNMASEPATELDFAAAAAYGVKVIRVGATCDAKDLTYLIDAEASTFEEDKRHFISVVPRLRKALVKAKEYGLKVIITMTDLPGSRFHSRPVGSSFPFWESQLCRSRAAKFWGLMAEALADINNTIMAYDVINEPYTLEDTDADFFEDHMPVAHVEELHQFYIDVVGEIRKYDKEVSILVKSTWFACPRTFEILRPLPDSNIIYSFHMYAPPFLTLRRNLHFSYPGPVSRWLHYPAETVNITPEFLHQLLESTVYSWQKAHQIPSHRILVAEFGICRERKGSQQYLNDLLSIFGHFGWSWLLFSFRDEEWDALDYELGTDKDNMLHRTDTELFLTVANYFH